MLYEMRQTFEHGKGVDEATGLLVSDKAFAVNAIPVKLPAGSQLKSVEETLEYRCFFYRPDTENELIYTYAYQPEANWTTYSREDSEKNMMAGSRFSPEDRFVRVMVREKDTNSESTFESLFRVEKEEGQEDIPEWMSEETERVCARADDILREGDAVFLLLADSHFTAGCIWDDTVQSIETVAQKLKPDGLIHLGDFTDGLLPYRHTREITKEMREDLKRACSPVFTCMGNHDLNYFKDNPDRMTRHQGAELILGEEQLWYFRDIPDRKLRMIFLDSFDPESVERYGFDRQEVRWLRKTLKKTPKGFRVLVFSHVTPLPENHVWSIDIRNSSKVMRTLEEFNRKNENAVIGWIYGHNHADQIIGYRDFPLISIGCSKLEEFCEHKPEDSVTHARKRGTRTQELWDVLIVHRDGDMDLIRYGAGTDRHVAGGERQNDRPE